MAEFDASGAKAAGYSDVEITKIQKGITDARAAGHSDSDISNFLARTGGRVTPTDVPDTRGKARSLEAPPTTEGPGFPRTGADLAKNMAGPGPGELTNDPYGPPGERTNAQPSWLDSLFGGVSHGVGKLLHGQARIGARMGSEPSQPGAESEITPQRLQQVDTTARQHEEAYQASPEKQAHPYVAGAGEIAGETAGLLAEGGPLTSLATAPARAAPRWLMNLGLGTAGALATPKGDEGMDPASQLKRGAAGLVGAAAGTAVGEVGSKLINAFVGRTAGDADVQGIYRRVIKPSRSGKDSLTDVQNHDRQIVNTFDDIIKTRKAEAQATGAQPQYPKSMKEYLEAQNQQVRSMFQEYDAKKAGAQAGTSAQPNPHLFNPFRATGVAVQEASNWVKQAERDLLALRAPGAPVHGGTQIAEGRLRQAVAELRKAQQAHGAVTEMMHKPYVDLSSVSNDLRKMAQESRFADLNPGTASAINGEADRLSQRGFYGLSEAQNNIAALNKSLDAYYLNPNPAASSKAVSDAHLAGALRQKLDETITNLTGPGYAALKKRYGDARQIEKQIAAAYQREGNKIEGGIGSIFADLFATAHGIKGIATLDPHALSAGLAAKGAQWMMKHLRDPNRAIQKLFIERAYEPGRARQLIGAMGRQQPMAYSIVGGQLGAEYQPNKARDTRDPRVPSAGQ